MSIGRYHAYACTFRAEDGTLCPMVHDYVDYGQDEGARAAGWKTGLNGHGDRVELCPAHARSHHRPKPEPAAEPEPELDGVEWPEPVPLPDKRPARNPRRVAA